jgi:multiple sugar transport system substrate-binding protein
MPRLVLVGLVALLTIAAPGVRAADLVVWWDKGFYPEEDEAVREIVTAFERDTGKRVELAQFFEAELPTKIDAAIQAGRPPDFAYGTWLSENIGRWAFDDRLVDLTDAIGPFSNLFDADALDSVTLANGRTGRRALYGLPVGRVANYFHVWKSVLKQAGFTLDDVPKEWDAFWSFWCDAVQPAARSAMGRDDIWGVALSMSATSPDTWVEFDQFMIAYHAGYVTADGRLVIDNPEVRRKLAKVIENYTAIYRKDCTPPDSVSWDSSDNNKRFLTQAVVTTPNFSLSVPNALKRQRPEDYYKNTATIEWPLGPGGEPFPIYGQIYPAVAFRGGANPALAKEFVSFLVRGGWLAHYLNFSGERVLPPMQKLLDQPFWLDPGDPHRMAAVMQLASRPLAYSYAAVSGNWCHQLVDQEFVWAKAIHRVAAEGISPEQAVDEAIARIKEILAQ